MTGEARWNYFEEIRHTYEAGETIKAEARGEPADGTAGDRERDPAGAQEAPKRSTGENGLKLEPMVDGKGRVTVKTNWHSALLPGATSRSSVGQLPAARRIRSDRIAIQPSLPPEFVAEAIPGNPGFTDSGKF